MVENLKETFLHISKISQMVYFSDGSGAQHKNYKNFINLCCHKNDFGIDAEWVFFLPPVMANRPVMGLVVQ